MQAIQTKYCGPTNTRGARIKATAQSGSITVTYDHTLDLEGNHIAAARALCEKLEWTADRYLSGELCCGQLPDGSWCHVWIPRVYSEAKEAVMLTRLAISRGENNGNPHGKPFCKLVVALTDDELSPWHGEYMERKLKAQGAAE